MQLTAVCVLEVHLAIFLCRERGQKDRHADPTCAANDVPILDMDLPID